MSARLLLRLSLACALAACTAPVAAQAAQAPGAPGERHTWAPADKHGFGTATRLQSNVWFTLRAAELTEIYYPDLSTPSFRDLEFAVTDGKTFLDRETDPRVRSEVRPQPGSLTFRQTTQTARWRLVKTWVTDPARPTVLANVRFESLTGRPLQVYLLADPAPGDDGNDDHGSAQDSALLAWDDTAASAVIAEPRLQQRDERLRRLGERSPPRSRSRQVARRSLHGSDGGQRRAGERARGSRAAGDTGR